MTQTLCIRLSLDIVILEDSKILFTIKNGNVYEGDSSSYSKILYKYTNDKIFEGDSSNSSKIKLTFKNNNFYKGDSTNSSKIVANVEGFLNEEEFVGIFLNMYLRLVKLFELWKAKFPTKEQIYLSLIQ